MWKYWKGSEGNGVSITIVLLWEEVKEEKRRRGEEEKRRRGEEEKRRRESLFFRLTLRMIINKYVL
ncbi:hypothetical protein [Bacillus cereus]|uniref:hypothetical protein n=1 Tax=Bacillus cereus TaxID=1396 RepID=UPI001E4CE0E0|nr:hypothetical protein [Bacillus cereus]MCC2448065.1 hypothetical protein [Bacillus cereus]